MPGVRADSPATNIVIAELEDPALQPASLLTGLEARGVRMLAFGGRRLRAIAHLDVDDAGIDRAIAAFQEVTSERSETPSR